MNDPEVDGVLKEDQHLSSLHKPVGVGGAFVVACIPAYNEEGAIARVVLGARRYVDRVVVCDDGSTDLSGEIAERLGALVVRHERNLGYGAAVGSLFREARSWR